ncbi:MAG: hypothetical protein EOP37_03305 [Rubrivivax sp.]|nr:MAG: hypothetical protein EOP37_03305 [Rubrivivax sp.]
MDKALAIAALGGTNAAAAKAIGISVQAVGQAPAKLPPRIADRYLAAIARRELPFDRLRQLGVSLGDVGEESAEG